MARSSSTRVLCRPVTERYAIHGVAQAGRRAFHHAMFDADTDLSGADLAGADLSEICYESKPKWPSGFSPPPSRINDCRSDVALYGTMGRMQSVLRPAAMRTEPVSLTSWNLVTSAG